MVFVGCVIRGTDFSQMKLTRDLAVVVLVRLLLFPVFVGVLVAALPIDSLTKQVYFVFATMPAMTQMGIMARETGSDYEFAAVLITVTTIFEHGGHPDLYGDRDPFPSLPVGAREIGNRVAERHSRSATRFFDPQGALLSDKP